MIEGSIGEFTSPLGGDADAAAESGQFITEIEPAVETSIGQFPHTVDAMGALRFS